MSDLIPSLPAQYDPKEAEPRLYKKWLQIAAFTPDDDDNKKPFTLIMPPPNVTGVLHMGHALMATLEDIIVRRKRMLGFNTLWLPGTDHAGIATQMVVERELLASEKKTKHDLGREEFLKRVWEWKEHSQGTILGQLRKIGASSDWTRLAFTLDEGPVKAVRECFYRLYQDGLIYRSTAMIHWCPRCRTALSDLEVKGETKTGSLWQIRYVLENDPSQALVVATTRPETLLGDAAVAVHPDDERYAAFHGKKVRLPLVDRVIPVITDAYVDREFGTGALKITPAHDPNDYEIGLKHKLPSINVMDELAQINEAGGAYKGLSREKAREKIVSDLEAKGLLESTEKYTHNVGHCDRCKTMVEPRVSQQWFVNAAELAKQAIRVVEDKEIRILPEEWEKVYFEWMRNIRPWCISRQLWWGHRIPVWYCNQCNETIVEKEDPTVCPNCRATELRQDDDVLDTWFSSGLWPISTLGWPKETADLKRFYPTDVMETGFDILFFWVARMVMLCVRMTGKIPFKTVYLHPMVRDEYGQKMSKTKGNVKDPLEIIDTMGADSLRMYFALNTFHGRDVRVHDGSLEGSRNFVNKLWNASRFVLGHFPHVAGENIDRTNPINCWLLHQLTLTKREVNKALEEYRFYEAAGKLYHFTWDTYCSRFLEMIKTPEELETRKLEVESTAVEVLEDILALLHPIMPFVTEEIWRHFPLERNTQLLALSSYPMDNSGEYPEQFAQVERVIEIVEAVRTQRGVSGISPSAKVHAVVYSPSASALEPLQRFSSLVEKMAGVEGLAFETRAEPDKKLHILRPVAEGVGVYLLKADLGDVDAEFKKMREQVKELREAIVRAESKLKNSSFVDKAPADVIDGVKKQRDELKEKADSIEKYLRENEA
ncbi:MAG: valine--tRNA ligase [Bdellovibrionales bacterium]|nr:valine--tRNA ligase [Bdellovibrionales bacterium]